MKTRNKPKSLVDPTVCGLTYVHTHTYILQQRPPQLGRQQQRSANTQERDRSVSDYHVNVDFSPQILGFPLLRSSCEREVLCSAFDLHL